MARNLNKDSVKLLEVLVNNNKIDRYRLNESKSSCLSITWQGNMVTTSRVHSSKELLELLNDIKDGDFTSLNLLLDNSMASSKVEKAHDRGDVDSQYRTYVKDHEKVFLTASDFEEEEEKLFNRYNLDSLIYDLSFLKSIGAKLIDNSNLIKLDSQHYITRHGIDLIRKIEKRDNFISGLIPEGV